MRSRGSRLLSIGRHFLRESRRYLVEEYPAKIRWAVEGLDDGQLWWRPNEASNSVGNLLLHLAGNLRQWVVHGLGGEPDRRDRAAEFSARGGMNARALLDHLEGATTEAGRVLEGLDPKVLERQVEIQGLKTDGLGALYHAVEHFSMHTGQILHLSKQLTNRDLGFYRVDDRGRVTGTDW